MLYYWFVYERERHQYGRETSIGCLIYKSWLGIKPTNKICAWLETNPPSFAVWDSAPTNWATQPMQEYFCNILLFLTMDLKKWPFLFLGKISIWMNVYNYVNPCCSRNSSYPLYTPLFWFSSPVEVAIIILANNLSVLVWIF